MTSSSDIARVSQSSLSLADRLRLRFIPVTSPNCQLPRECADRTNDEALLPPVERENKDDRERPGFLLRSRSSLFANRRKLRKLLMDELGVSDEWIESGQDEGTSVIRPLISDVEGASQSEKVGLEIVCLTRISLDTSFIANAFSACRDRRLGDLSRPPTGMMKRRR